MMGCVSSAEKPLWNKASPTVPSWNQPQRGLLGTRSSSGCAKWISCARQWQRDEGTDPRSLTAMMETVYG